MRLFQTLLNGRRPQDLNKVAFKALLPLRLRNYVSGKSDRTAEVPCLQELSILFASLKNHEFNESYCTKEVEDVQRAHVAHLKKKFDERRDVTKGIMTTGRDLTYRQLNKYLRRYPNPK